MANTLSLGGLLIDTNCLGSTQFLTSVRPYYAYTDGVKTKDVMGYRYTVVLPEKQFASLDVKIPGEQQIVLADGNYIPVQFGGLTVKLYYDSNHRVQVTATASEISEVS